MMQTHYPALENGSTQKFLDNLGSADINTITD